MAEPVILTRTISAAQDNRIVVGNGLFLRPLPFGTDWNSIRVGVRWSMRDSGANLTGTPRCFLGVCSGDTNAYGDATTTHAVGVDFNAATWTRAASNYSITPASSLFGAKRVNTTTTRTATFSTAWAIGNQSAASNADRTVWVVYITKGSPNFTLQTFYRNTTSIAPPADVSLATFLEQIAVSGTPIITNHTQSAALTLAVDEGTDGDLDHINFHWDRATPEIEICDIAVVRMS